MKQLSIIPCLFFIACSSSTSNGIPFVLDGATDSQSDALVTDSPAPFDADVPADGKPPVDVKAQLVPGSYASRQRFSSVVNLPPTGTPSTSETISMVLHTVRVEDGKLVSVNKTCDIRQPPKNGVSTVFTAGFLAAIPETKVAILQELGATSASVTFEKDVFVVGATLTDIANEALPKSSSDSRVTDSDKDGKPGVTVKLTGFISGDVYVVQRNTGGMKGTLTTDGRMQGLLLGDAEQVILGSSNPLLTSFSLNPKKDPDASKSNFSWVKVDASLTCAQLVQQEETLFGKL